MFILQDSIRSAQTDREHIARQIKELLAASKKGPAVSVATAPAATPAASDGSSESPGDSPFAATPTRFLGGSEDIPFTILKPLWHVATGLASSQRGSELFGTSGPASSAAAGIAARR